MGRAVRQFEKEVSLELGTGVEYVAWNCMGHAVRQFEKKKLVKSETELGYVTSNCMGRSVPQFDKEVSFKLGEANLYNRIN